MVAMRLASWVKLSINRASDAKSRPFDVQYGFLRRPVEVKRPLSPYL